MQVIKELFRRTSREAQVQDTREQSQRTLSARERYQAGVDPFDPIKAIIEKLRAPAANDGNSFGAPAEDQETGSYPFNKFWLKFLTQIAEQDDGQLALRQTKQLRMLNLAMYLSEIHASENEQTINGFYTENGIGNFDLLPNSHLITDRRKDAQGKVTGSVLERIVIDVLKNLPHSAAVIKFVDENDVKLEEVIQFAYEKCGGTTNGKERDRLRTKIKEMLRFFEEDVENNPELKALLDEVWTKIIDHKKTRYQTESDDNPEMKTALEDNKKAVKAEFGARAPQAKAALEQLYRFKKLNGRQAFRLLKERNNDQERALFGNLGVNLDELTREFFAAEVRPKIQNAKNRGKWPADLDSKSLPDENNAEEWCEFLINNPLGKKIAQLIRLDLSAFSEKLSEAADRQIRRICPLAEATEAGSFDDLTDKLVEATNIDVSRYIATIMVSRNRYASLQQDNPQLWRRLAVLTSTPQKQRGKLKDVVARIAKGLKSKPEYESVEGAFNRLAYAVLGHYNTTQPKRQQRNQRTDKEYVDMCIEAMDRGGEGFNKDYLYNVPVADKEAVNFNDFDRDGSKVFTFEQLLTLYAKSISDPALVDIAHEIEQDILLPILIESGISLSEDEQYNPDNERYIDQADFELAKSMGAALRGLKKAKLNRLPKQDEEEEEGKETETVKGYELTDQDKKAAEANVRNILGKAKELDKRSNPVKTDDEVKEDAKKRF